jgi:hypothetical protein
MKNCYGYKEYLYRLKRVSLDRRYTLVLQFESSSGKVFNPKKRALSYGIKGALKKRYLYYFCLLLVLKHNFFTESNYFFFSQ